MNPISDSRLFLGIDLGTTTLSLVLYDAASCAVIHQQTLLHDSRLPHAQGQSMQNAERIAELALNAISCVLDAFPGVSAIGVTGQMHGILCLDEQGNPVSPLYTWQNQLADERICDEIRRKTGHAVHPGYGHATLYALSQAGQLPLQARQYCTIMDYIVMRLTGRKTM